MVQKRHYIVFSIIEHIPSSIVCSYRELPCFTMLYSTPTTLHVMAKCTNENSYIRSDTCICVQRSTNKIAPLMHMCIAQYTAIAPFETKSIRKGKELTFIHLFVVCYGCSMFEQRKSPMLYRTEFELTLNYQKQPYGSDHVYIVAYMKPRSNCCCFCYELKHIFFLQHIYLLSGGTCANIQQINSKI